MTGHTNRIGWDELPGPLRAAFTTAMGAAVTTEQRQTGGFSPGLASRLTLADGRRVFLKAISTARDPHAPALYRREAQVMRDLPATAPAPRLRWSYDDGTWVALALDDIDGHPPAQPWTIRDLDRVVTALAAMADTLTPAFDGALPITDDLADNFSSWRRMAAGDGPHRPDRLPARARDNLDLLADLESGWAEAATGKTLAHTDLRADNLLLTRDTVMVVDWPYAVTTTPWMDLLFLLPSVAAFSGIDPEPVWRAHPHTRTVPAEQVDAVLAALCGDHLTQSLRPPPANIPGLRAHQAAKGQAGLTWLMDRRAARARRTLYR
ncbi:phosphotransferase family protein [Spirillospora albida]|uniref:phosphotransferase family protein n=1 Tax=Spirillospora albida TaxID=58123 RepID=UPI000562FFFD|nr:aminoglycoside phosphotransferase family protein [Spirillospora albida]